VYTATAAAAAAAAASASAAAAAALLELTQFICQFLLSKLRSWY